MDFRPAFRALVERFEADLSDVVHKVTRQNLPARAFKEQPALVVLENGVAPYDEDGARGAWELKAILVLHAKTLAEDEAPGDTVLELVARIEKALQWRVGERTADDGYSTTLGGVVDSARLGAVVIDDDIDTVGQVSIVMDVTMLVFPQSE